MFWKAIALYIFWFLIALVYAVVLGWASGREPDATNAQSMMLALIGINVAYTIVEKRQKEAK